MEEQSKFSHLNKEGLPEMVDISSKRISERVALASGFIFTGKEIMKELAANDYSTKKGSISTTASLAGTMAVKNTWNTIPLCHQIPITSCKFKIEPEEEGFKVFCTVKTNGNTGVEMEALQGVSVACLTIYDMCKALSHDMIISDIKLELKKGGKRDFNRKTS